MILIISDTVSLSKFIFHHTMAYYFIYIYKTKLRFNSMQFNKFSNIYISVGSFKIYDMK